MGILQLCLFIGLLVALSNGFVNRHGNALEELETLLEDELVRELGENVENSNAEQKRGQAKRRTAPNDAIHKFHNGGKKRGVNKLAQRMMEEEEREQRLLEKIGGDGSLNGISEGTMRELVSLTSRQLILDSSPFCTLEGINTTCVATDYRRIDGTCNNINNVAWGMAKSLHERVLADKHAYNNRLWAFRTRSVVRENGDFAALPDPRVVSNTIHKAEAANAGLTETDRSHIDMAWAQFIVHDIISTPDFDVDETRIDCCIDTTNFQCMSLIVGAGDDHFDPGYCMDLKRSDIRASCENDPVSNIPFANQMNEHTSFIDGSAVYGNDDATLYDLRTHVGGLMFVLNDDKPPKDMSGDIPCTEDEPGYCFRCGDHRANVIAPLSMLHAVFLATHNAIATDLHGINPTWNDEKLFQETRKIIGAIMQHITYTEFLPSILNPTVISDYGLTPSATQSSSIYDVDTNPTFSNIAAIAMRYGHSLIMSEMKLFNAQYVVDDDNDVYNVEDMYLRNKYLFYKDYEGDAYLARFLTTEQSYKSDRFMEDSARNLLFKENTTGVIDSFDLAAVNIQRGRDWGTGQYYQYYGPNYCNIGEINVARRQVGDWADMAHHSAEVRDLLASIYEHPGDVDPFTGLVSEERMDNSLLGPTSNCIIAKQFEALKKGDRFFYETNDADVGFTTAQFTEIKKITLAKLLCERLGLSEVQPNVFNIPNAGANQRESCSAISDIDLTQWNVENE